MFWAPFGWNYKGDIEFIDGRIDAVKYVDMLKNKIEQINNHVWHEKWIFQHDNEPYHRAKLTMNWFNNIKFEVLAWQPCSPDLKPIENVWGLLLRKTYCGGRQFYSI